MLVVAKVVEGSVEKLFGVIEELEGLGLVVEVGEGTLALRVEPRLGSPPKGRNRGNAN
jgi:hypothetical protein